LNKPILYKSSNGDIPFCKPSSLLKVRSWTCLYL